MIYWFRVFHVNSKHPRSHFLTFLNLFSQFDMLDEAVVREVMMQTGPIQHAVFSVRYLINAELTYFLVKLYSNVVINTPL